MDAVPSRNALIFADESVAIPWLVLRQSLNDPCKGIGQMQQNP